MLPINSSSVIGNLAPRSFITSHQDPDREVDKTTALQGIKVTLSEQAQKISEAAQSNDDIDKSSLPDNIKQALKMLRELKEQLAEKQAELRAIMADQSLSEDERAQKAQGVQSEIATLSGAITTVNGTLIQAIKEAGLSQDQLTELSTLMMA